MKSRVVLRGLDAARGDGMEPVVCREEKIASRKSKVENRRWEESMSIAVVRHRGGLRGHDFEGCRFQVPKDNLERETCASGRLFEEEGT